MFKRRSKPVASTSGSTGRRAGQSAREKQRELASAAPIRTWLARLLNIPTNERAWRIGAEGEELVGASLDPLRSHGWYVEHDVRIGARGANVDHLVIGPPGVIAINTKAVSGAVTVAGPNLYVNGFPTDFIEKQECEAQRVRSCLIEATRRRSLWVQGLLVFVRERPVIKATPRHVGILHISELLPVLQALPSKLEAREVAELVRAAQRNETWRQ
ncbi:nuclease-related domain-containing protein [Myxococcus faecalis]|uniref:nuclease-related domain-containing protein n=1 Tax=Myxococcus faecalis TaxID=3115646 RepID=UPI003CF6EC8D